MKRKCIMLECSNENSKGIQELGKTGTLNIDRVFYFRDIQSSKISKIEFIEELIKIKTLNTEYLFKIL